MDMNKFCNKMKTHIEAAAEEALLKGIAIGYKATMDTMKEKYGIEPEKEEETAE